MDDGLEAYKPDSETNSRAYSLSLKQIPDFDLATSMPKKYFKAPMSLQNTELSYLFKSSIPSISSPVIKYHLHIPAK